MGCSSVTSISTGVAPFTPSMLPHPSKRQSTFTDDVKRKHFLSWLIDCGSSTNTNRKKYERLDQWQQEHAGKKRQLAVYSVKTAGKDASSAVNLASLVHGVANIHIRNMLLGRTTPYHSASVGVTVAPIVMGIAKIQIQDLSLPDLATVFHGSSVDLGVEYHCYRAVEASPAGAAGEREGRVVENLALVGVMTGIYIHELTTSSQEIGQGTEQTQQ